ncbi:MAG: hypothetical protein ACHBN1_32595 [Heteroscytonema crispum UTEX LB 1556]
MKFIRRVFDSRFWSLAFKEISQMRRNKQLIFLLTVSPILQLLIFGLNILYPHVIALIVFAIILLSTSAVKFRSQLS